MIRLFFIFFVSCLLNAELIEEIELSKDELKVINLLVENTQKVLTLRWTLYKDNGLVLHIKYDNFPHQVVLYKASLNSYKVILENLANNINENPNIIIYFINFDMKTNKAMFRYYLNKFNSNIEII